MKQYFYLLFFVTVLCSIAYGQGIVITPPNVTETGNASDFEIILESMVHNNTGSTVSLTWKRNTISLPGGWSNAICDKNICYAPFVSAQSFTLAPGDSGKLLSHFYPNGTSGIGEVEVTVYDATDSVNTDVTARYTASTYPLSSGFIKSKETLTIYPNPAKKIIYVKVGSEKAERVEIYNVLGARQVGLSVEDEASILSINIDRLPEGMYFARLIGRNNQVIQTKTFTKVK